MLLLVVAMVVLLVLLLLLLLFVVAGSGCANSAGKAPHYTIQEMPVTDTKS